MVAARFPRTLLWLGACLLVLPAAGHAQWKWRDGSGQIQYSDLPPPKGTPPHDVLQVPRASPVARLVQPEPAASRPVPAATQPPTDPVLDAKRKQTALDGDAAKRQAEDARVAQQRQQNCERARNNMRTLETGQRLARVNARGEREIVDDNARQTEIIQARQTIAAECR